MDRYVLWFVGFVGFIDFIGFIGFVSFIWFTPLLLSLYFALTLLSPCSCQAEPTLLRLSAPVKAFGELHRGVDVDMGGGLRGGLVLSRSSGTCTVSTLT